MEKLHTKDVENTENTKDSDAVNTSSITFQAIKDFVEDLISIFGTGGGKSPLGLYNRLISHVEAKDASGGVEKYLTGFNVFFASFDEKLESCESLLTIPRDTFIRYGDSPRVYLEIQKYIYLSRSKPEQLENIRKHLLTISATIDPNEKSLTALDASPIIEQMGIGGGTAESKFVKEQMAKIKKTFENGNVDTSDPTAAVMGLLQGGLITDMIKQLQVGVESNTLDPTKMLAGLQSTLSDLVSNDDGDNNIDFSQITMLTQQAAMGIVNANNNGNNNGDNANDESEAGSATTTNSQIEEVD